jgi:branched-chain amino acid transport system substrate-binding protein
MEDFHLKLKSNLFLFIIFIFIVSPLLLSSCNGAKSGELKVIDIEKRGLRKGVKEVIITEGYPMFDPFHKVFEPKPGFTFPEGVDSLDITEIDEDDISAIYYPLVSEKEKNEFYQSRFGKGRALNVKILVRQSIFDKRLIKNNEWYPYPSGVKIKGTVEKIPGKILRDFEYWEKSGEYPLPPLIMDDDPILIDVKEFTPNEKDSYTIKTGVIVEDSESILTEDVISGSMTAFENALKGESVIYNSERPIEFIVKEVKDTEEAKQTLNELYSENNAVAVATFVTNDTAKELLPIAKEHKKLLFVDSAYDDDITTRKHWNKYIFKTSPNIYQRAIATTYSFDASDSEVIVITEDSTDGDIAYKGIKDGIAEQGGNIVKHYSIDSNDEPDYDFSELKGITEIDASHLLIFWDINDKKPSEALRYSPLSTIVKGEWKERLAKFQIVIEIPSLKVIDGFKGLDGFIGSTYYNHQLADTHLNDYLLTKTDNPDTQLCQGFSTSYIMLSLILRSDGNFDIENLRELLFIKNFQTPKNFITFRREDNQALQFMFSGVLRESEDGKYDFEEPNGTSLINYENIAPPVKN